MDYSQVMQNWHDQPYKDRERDLRMQQMLQQLTENAIKDRQAAEDRRRAMLGAAKGVDTLSSLDIPPGGPPPGAPSAPPVAPPISGLPSTAAPTAAPIPQSPAPGASSMPMQRPPVVPPNAPPPGPPPMPNAAQNAVDPAARALMLKLAQGGPAQVKVSPQGAIAATPPGWKPSPSASPALGGMPPGSVGAAGTSLSVPSAPPMGAPGGDPMAGIDKSRMIDPKDFIAKAIKGGATPMEAFDQFTQMKPIIDAHNNQIIKDFGVQAKIAAETINFQRQKLAEYRAKESLQARKDNLVERTRHDLAMEGKSSGAFGSGATSGPTGLTPEGLDLAAEKYLATGVMPALGFSTTAAKLALINRAAVLSAERGIKPSTVPGRQAEFKANSGALNNITKDLAAIAPYQEMLEKNADIAIDLAKAVTKSDLPIANRSINWISQNVTGDPTMAQYLAQIRIVQTEAARVLNNPRLVGQLTDSARHEMEGIVNGTLTVSQTVSVLARLKADGNNRVNAMRQESEKLRKRLGAQEDSTSATVSKESGPAAGNAQQPTYTPEQLAKAIKDKKIKKGDTFLDPDGVPHRVN